MNKKGVFVTIFFGGILLTSTIAIAIPGMEPEMDNPDITFTGTPADNFPDDQRTTFCSSGGDAKSTDYVKEYLIPTECTNPLSIVSDYDGNVWFTETNTGNIGKFDPTTETFTEFDNPTWPDGGRSMMWGIDYAPDGSVWFTDETYDSVWKFSTIDETYERLSYPSNGDSLPQKLRIDGSQIIVNDFTGNKLTILDVSLSDAEVNYLSIPSPIDDSVTADFAIDENDNIWYTNWLYQQGGILVKFNQNDYRDDVSNSGEQFLPLTDYVIAYPLPVQLLTPNGITFSDDGILWIADTTSSSFFSFDPSSEQFIQYTTSPPMFETYGNQTGVIKSPISRPYWIENDNQGRLVFNEQTANNISIMDPRTQSLVEYHVPSKNPNWGDCDSGIRVLDNCGIAQIFDFTISDDKIWFTEWVENKIGVVDTSVPLPLAIELEKNTLNLASGESQEFQYAISVESQNDNLDLFLVAVATHDFLSIDVLDNSADLIAIVDDPAETIVIPTVISASDDALPGTYKILLGTQSGDVTISKFLTVIIE
tara:strand:+ start:440 stop:2047 length:1608 start_codon:yes stop_codon:yes gene_type:complete